ncbi:murein hydrolase activator EnvC family protein [Hymenobacter sp. CRA2]|uniref:murein hydrolase activator EnvC family protein n=1 Tax=Hymenobacter sp. CRA2 TaxID=1955620 RepID=UPI00098F2AE9|nr:M23 family metallopeptidase [Hymenobacter sp. CRA2]OON66736.1 peptidase M23 [Hymenobacter sp. CRA2]
MGVKTASKQWAGWLLAGSLVLALTVAPAQQRRRSSKEAPKTKAQLERERRNNLKRIQETSKILEQTQQKKQSTLGQLNALKEKITVQKEVIKSTSSELRYIETGVKKTATNVQLTQSELDRLKAEYGRLIYASAKTANSYNRIMFLFAADSFNEFMLRLRYVRQYSEARRQQVSGILRTQQELHQQLSSLTQQKQQKSSLLSTQLTENRTLVTMRTQQDQVVQQLSQQEQQLQKELAERQQAVRKLDDLIAQRVREEIARAARLAAARAAAKAAAAKAAAKAAAERAERAERSNATVAERTTAKREATQTAEAADAAVAAEEATTNTDRVTLTPETAELSSSFAENRGRLLWPVGRGFISQRFGRHPHPVLKHVTVDNRGVDIQTSAGEQARAIFDGKVLTVANIAGMNNVVMVQHGEYFTVYAKLRTVSVSEGQQIKMRQLIGTVYTNPEGTTELQFQVWRNSTNLNPEQWLGRK